MGRPKREGLDDRRTVLNRSANEAAALLLENLTAFSIASQTYLRWSCEKAQTNGPADRCDSNFYLGKSMKLAHVCAKLGQSLSGLKGGTRHSVERVAPLAINAPPESDLPGDKSLDAIEDSEFLPAQEEGGGSQES